MKLLLLLSVLLMSSSVFAAPPSSTAHVPGDLARDRLSKMAPMLLSASRVSVGGLDQRALSPAHAKAVLATLSDLVLDDALYVKDAESKPMVYSVPDQSTPKTVVVGLLEKSVTICIWRTRPVITITLFGGSQQIIADYLPVLPKVIRLFQAIDSSDPGPNFAPVMVQVSPPSTTGIPASVLTHIATLKPGMTRADVLRMFTTEGGLSSTYWNHYVYRSGIPSKLGHPDDMLQVAGGLVKVDVNFAPCDADIDWIDGQGFWLQKDDYESRHSPARYDGLPSDIILSVSLPYVQQMIAN